jgi:hypothetical protein
MKYSQTMTERIIMDLFEYFKSQLTNNPKDIDTCYCYGCDEKTSIAIRNKLTKDVHFYCKNCGEGILKVNTFNMFEIALNDKVN